MESLFIPTQISILAEIGDKTQLLAMLLTLRFRKPWPIVWGMLVGILGNHILAAEVGHLAAGYLSEVALNGMLAVAFAAIAVWTLLPDQRGDDDDSRLKRYGPFLTSTVAFFFAEMADKTQVATLVLAAQYEYPFFVAVGTTLGIVISNAPVVLLAGNFVAQNLPLKLIRRIAALAFICLAVYSGYETAKLAGWL
ncbi:TMEM165/GDT1 family protein [Azotobacter chroococcum]|uniref:GDT1 family protein n=1 Tax=Azotobacter chroococcum TaxID=353 RepID=A0AA44C5M5_9GAMM|nr:TMEM165/GDT1 family protein [Azotobacter chroococcum]NHN76759.1 TMEM165/GDT1 family protein [Azotobacter chroococcum]TBW06531.1 TMEM165/GDT1 family protein [Azotobacter chroococcum subsp. isscasi]